MKWTQYGIWSQVASKNARAILLSKLGGVDNNFRSRSKISLEGCPNPNLTPRNFVWGIYCPPSWRPPATRVSFHAPSHVAVHVKALQNISTFCINPTSTITMFGTSIMPTTYSDSSQDNPKKFEIPWSSTHWFMSLLDTVVPGRLWSKFIVLHIMPKFGEFFISRVQKFNKEFLKNVCFQVCTKSIFENKDVIPNWNRPGRIGSRNHTLFVVVEDMLQGWEDPTR